VAAAARAEKRSDAIGQVKLNTWLAPRPGSYTAEADQPSSPATARAAVILPL
jgi:hypothetical protein